MPPDVPDFVYALFAIDVVILLITLAGTLWSLAFPDRRIWPPPHRYSWQHVLSWTCFFAVCGLNTALLFLDWNSWMFGSDLRFVIGIPVTLLGGFLAAWGVAALGMMNSSGLKGGFVASGPYRFTRNPQYLGDIIFFVGVSIIANSLLLWITHALLILVFVVAPLIEERWLEDQYGQAYREYRRAIPRFWSLRRGRRTANAKRRGRKDMNRKDGRSSIGETFGGPDRDAEESPRCPVRPPTV